MPTCSEKSFYVSSCSIFADQITCLKWYLSSTYTTVLKLFWLVTLGLVVVYIYSVAAFAYFANEFHDPDSSDVQYCSSLVQCYVTIFHYILIGGVSCSLTFKQLHTYVYVHMPHVHFRTQTCHQTLKILL